MDKRIRPCDNCGGKIGPTFYIVKIATGVVNYGAANRLMGLSTYFGGGQVGNRLAEVFSPDSTMHTVVEGDKADLWTERVICPKCYVDNSILHFEEK